MKMYKMNEALINAEKLKKFLKESFSWLVVGIGLMGFPLWIQYNRSSQLEELLTTSQKNERLLQGKIISCKEEAQKDALQSVYENMEMIRRMQDVMNKDNYIKEELIRQSKVRQESANKMNKELDKIIKDEKS